MMLGMSDFSNHCRFIKYLSLKNNGVAEKALLGNDSVPHKQ